MIQWKQKGSMMQEEWREGDDKEWSLEGSVFEGNRINASAAIVV